MPRKNHNTLHLHSKLALEIKAAKKKMFQRHREGMSPREAADKFVIDMVNRFEAALGKRELDALCDCPQPVSVLHPSCPVCDCPHCDIMPADREKECPRCNYFHCRGEGNSERDRGYSRLSEKEFELACERVGESLGGEYFIGLLILLLNHLLAVQFSERSNLEGAVIDIQEVLLRTNSHATAFAVEALKDKTAEHLRLKARGIDMDWNTGAIRPEAD